MLLENELIRLRAPEPEDLADFYRWENDTSLWESGSALAPYSRYQLKQLIAGANDIYENKQLRFTVEETASHRAVGTVDIYDFTPHHNRASFGLLIDRAHQKKGYACMALNLMRDYAFEFLHLHQLYCFASERNIPSIRMLERCGFVSCGVLKDWLRTGNGYDNAILFSSVSK
ncbi:MAG: GNAT family N-acetyltransferase [Tannerella sp.]|jgi:diamine N-acetyltransferase|nr:GNAT family N-acetyltransferase [Tannerella sp.]